MTRGVMTTHDTITRPDCMCDSDEVDALRDLIGEGVDQWTTSLVLWSPPTPATIRLWVRRQYQVAFPDLVLPALEVA